MYKYCLVVENDIVFKTNDINKINEAHDLLRKNKSYDWLSINAYARHKTPHGYDCIIFDESDYLSIGEYQYKKDMERKNKQIRYIKKLIKIWGL